MNTYPYIGRGDWFGVAVHGVAPVMMGVALIAHDAVSRRLGQAIAAAAATAPTGDDIADRLTALAQTAAPRHKPQPVPIHAQPPPPTWWSSSASSNRRRIAGTALASEADSAREDTPASRAMWTRPAIVHGTSSRTALLSWEPIPYRSPPRAPHPPTSQTMLACVTGAQSYRSCPHRRPRAASDTGRSPVTHASTMDGALARATDHTRTSGLFTREMSHAEATNLARAVLDRGKSRQPADLLAKIYLAHSQGQVPNAIGTTIGLPHSTVNRAITAAAQITGGQLKAREAGTATWQGAGPLPC